MCAAGVPRPQVSHKDGVPAAGVPHLGQITTAATRDPPAGKGDRVHTPTAVDSVDGAPMVRVQTAPSRNGAGPSSANTYTAALSGGQATATGGAARKAKSSRVSSSAVAWIDTAMVVVVPPTVTVAVASAVALNSLTVYGGSDMAKLWAESRPRMRDPIHAL